MPIRPDLYIRKTTITIDQDISFSIASE